MLIHVAFHLVHKVKLNLVLKFTSLEMRNECMFNQEIIGTNISSLKKKQLSLGMQYPDL